MLRLNLVLKIALGVFLGAAALLLVMKIPGAIQDMRREHQVEIMLDLTPAKLIALCGTPTKDETVKLVPGLKDSVLDRHITYKLAVGTLVFNFVQTQDGASLVSVADDLGHK